jgi:D-beta-D-heptose 7-phosphate kinase/D-beta-D-heptose 1-phosphate adenosyltransferase
MSLFESGSAPVHIPTVAREVFDVSGAGDTVISTLTLALAAGANLRRAALLSNQAAGIVVAKLGTATTDRAELSGALR